MSPGQHITILLEAARKAAIDPKHNLPIEGSVLRAAPSHTGAELLGALREMGWTLAPIAPDWERHARTLAASLAGNVVPRSDLEAAVAALDGGERPARPMNTDPVWLREKLDEAKEIIGDVVDHFEVGDAPGDLSDRISEFVYGTFLDGCTTLGPDCACNLPYAEVIAKAKAKRDPDGGEQHG